MEPKGMESVLCGLVEPYLHIRVMFMVVLGRKGLLVEHVNNFVILLKRYEIVRHAAGSVIGIEYLFKGLVLGNVHPQRNGQLFSISPR